MPELPEVEVVRMQLAAHVSGKRVTSVEVLHDKTVAYDRTAPARLEGKTIRSIERVGKLLIISFTEDDDLFVLVHLKMTGQFFYVSKDETVVGGGHSLDDKTLFDGVWPHKHTRLIVRFSDDTVLYFNDMRLFGYFVLSTRKKMEQARQRFGPEPQRDDFDDAAFFEKLHRRKTTIKAALLDQTLLAGLGNIYVDETLWRVKVAPDRRANTLTKAEVRAVRKAASEVLTKAIAAGGTTFQSFKDVENQAGTYREELVVFGKQGTPCPRCQTLIEKTRVAGRGTHWCPSCQQ